MFITFHVHLNQFNLKELEFSFFSQQIIEQL
jgi:hypothetical protein